MRKKTFARNLAASIVNSVWNFDAVAADLAAILPRKLRWAGGELAGDILFRCKTPYAPPLPFLVIYIEKSNAFHKVFNQLLQRGYWPQEQESSPEMRPVPSFAELPIPRLVTSAALADWLHLTTEELDYFADRQGRVEEAEEVRINHYFYHILAKKSGGQRLIEAPKARLKAIQRQILHDILDRIPPHGDSFGFVAGRNCIDAARRHCGENVVVSFDLKSFFNAVPSARIHAIFRCLGYPYPVAQAMTGLVSVQTPQRVLLRMAADLRPYLTAPHLPQGAPTSPALASAAAFGLDRRLRGLARHLTANYSRYADDLTFSGDRSIVAPLLGLVPEIVRDEGFALNAAKTRVTAKHAAQVVTGIVVNEHVNVSRSAFDHLKAVIHACAKKGDPRLMQPEFVARMHGQIGWVEAVNPARGMKLRARWEGCWSKAKRLENNVPFCARKGATVRSTGKGVRGTHLSAVGETPAKPVVLM